MNFVDEGGSAWYCLAKEGMDNNLQNGPEVAQKARSYIWVIEDDEPIARVLQMLMQEEGYDVAVANSLDEARALPGTPDLVLLDYLLPDGNGILYLPELERAHPGTPVILLTALERVGLTSFPSHVTYLPKPFKNRQLVQLVAEQFAAQREP